jgi:cysteine synthase
VISQAEADGRLKRGNTVVEYTGGSTGASLALVCAAKGSRTGYYPMGEEIWRQTEEKVDAFVQSVGTAALSRGGGGPEATQARDPPWRRA